MSACALRGDDPARSRGYELLMQMLYEGVNSGDLGSMLGWAPSCSARWIRT